jgi:transposase InsO family protein
VCWHNAAAESFFGALKSQMYYRQSFPDRARARFAVADYIEVFYNRKQLHSALGYRTPPRYSPNSRPQPPLHDQQPGENVQGS